MPETRSIPKVDAHHHLWDADLYDYPGLRRSDTTIARRYLLHDFLADAANQTVRKSVHVQGEITRDQSVAETEWLQRIADAHAFPHAIVAYAALQDPRVESVLEAHARSANLRGIRQILNPDQCERADLLTDATWRAGYARLTRFGLSFDLQALPDQLPDAADVARAHPDVPMIVNHAGMPRDQSPDGLERWRAGMRRLAEVDHVTVKLSGFAMFDANWTVERIRPLVLETIELFGAHRCMFASNFPVDKQHASFDALFDAFGAITANFSATERDHLFHATAERVYRV